MEKLVKKLIAEGVLRSQNIIDAFLAVDRKEFVSKEYETEAYVDAPLPIGEGQTISQPYTVAFMLELLEPRRGQKIMDVGFGSGWTTALLARLAGPRGEVHALEIVAGLWERGKSRVERFDCPNVKFYNQSGWEGLQEIAPFDRILVSAAADRVPEKLKNQLAEGGRMVIPVGASPFYGQSVKLIIKRKDGKFDEDDYPGFAFVPLVR